MEGVSEKGQSPFLKTLQASLLDSQYGSLHGVKHADGGRQMQRNSCSVRQTEQRLHD